MAYQPRSRGPVSVRVDGETYRSSSELEEEIRTLQASCDQMPEYGPGRQQLDAHVAKLQAALRRLKAQEADHARRTTQAATTRQKRDTARAARTEQRRTDEKRRQRRAANARAARGVRSFVRGGRRDTRRAAGALGVAQPVSSA